MATGPTQPTRSVKKRARSVSVEVISVSMPWFPLILLVIIAVMGWLLMDGASIAFDPEKLSVDRIALLLGALIVISAFIERFLEVFVNAWRGFGSEQINHEIELAQAIIDDENATEGDREAAEEAKAANLEAKWVYTLKTRHGSSLAAIFLGAIVALLGVHALEPLVDITKLSGTQLHLFKTFDVVLTAGLIGGGTDGLHKLMSTITTVLDETKKRTKG